MLSRSNSHAGERLRRAKSNASATTTASSNHRRASTSIDPFISRHDAEVAAVEAYNRARQSQDYGFSAYNTAAQRPQRRRSQVTGKSEGGHFQDARLAHRRSTSIKEESNYAKQNYTRRDSVGHTQRDTDTSIDGPERVVTRRRSVIPPSAYSHSQNGHLSLPPVNRHLRRAQSAYSEGSPTPRHSSQYDERSSILQVQTPVRSYSVTHGGSSNAFTNFYSEGANFTGKSNRPSIRETQTDEEILNLARDKCLQDFYRRKPRQRKSFILAPFQKRRETKENKITDDEYDTTLPPFNYAMDISMMPSSSPTQETTPKHSSPVSKFDRKARNFSDTLKGRIMKVFRKTSRVSTGIPAQQIEATHQHYGIMDSSRRQSLSKAQADPFVVNTPGTQAVRKPFVSKGDRAESRSSIGRASTMKSRVTSWANSTTGGTWSTRADDDRLASVNEYGVLKQKESNPTLRKRSSFFGRPVVNKLRRSSKADLCSSEESQGLYAALQERIKPKTTSSSDPVLDGEHSTTFTIPSMHLTLPSQRRASSTTLKSTLKSRPIVRSVSPGEDDQYLEVPSPTIGVLSPVAETPPPDISKSNLQPQYRLSPKKIEPPSQELIAKRMEKSKNRWQSSLQELSSRLSASGKILRAEDNPYDLPSMRQPPQAVSTVIQVPAAKENNTERAASVIREFLSPSIYSRGTNSVSPKLESPPDNDGTIITITGHEIRRYSISPKKKDGIDLNPIQGSSEWRRWVSSEMDGLKSEGEDYALMSSMLQEMMVPGPEDAAIESTEASNEKSTESTDSNAVPTNRKTSAGQDRHSPADETVPKARPSRPRQDSSRRSSLMNDRYPMIDTGRNSSNNSVGSGRLSSSRGANRNSSTESQKLKSGRPTSIQSQPQKSTATRPNTLTERRSIANMETTTKEPTAKERLSSRLRSTLSVNRTSSFEPSSERQSRKIDSTTGNQDDESSTRTKSAFDLRANFKTSTSTASKPLEVRRRQQNLNINNTSMIDDDTIVAISAGPYAPQKTTLKATNNKENATPPPPMSETSSLPALSSSEWLAASGPNSNRKPSAIHPALRDRSFSKRQLSTKVSIGDSPLRNAGGERGSPAQRMATEFLDRRSRESTPAFM